MFGDGGCTYAKLKFTSKNNKKTEKNVILSWGGVVSQLGVGDFSLSPLPPPLGAGRERKNITD